MSAKPKRARQLGVTDDEYARMLAAQGGGCAICGATPKTRRLHVDHDHKTGTVRGLLCHRCNRALPTWVTTKWLAMAYDYLDDDYLEPVDLAESLRALHEYAYKMPPHPGDVANKWREAVEAKLNEARFRD
jgi:hypothetical protein